VVVMTSRCDIRVEYRRPDGRTWRERRYSFSSTGYAAATRAGMSAARQGATSISIDLFCKPRNPRNSRSKGGQIYLANCGLGPHRNGICVAPTTKRGTSHPLAGRRAPNSWKR
jgi:hypothetical protein